MDNDTLEVLVNNGRGFAVGLGLGVFLGAVGNEDSRTPLGALYAAPQLSKLGVSAIFVPTFYLMGSGVKNLLGSHQPNLLEFSKSGFGQVFGLYAGLNLGRLISKSLDKLGGVYKNYKIKSQE